MTSLLDYLDGTDVTVAPFAEITNRPESMVKAVGDAVAHIGSAYSEHVRPSLAGEGIERGLPNQHDDGLYEELLSAGQKRVWDFLRRLSVGACRLEVPAEIRESPVLGRDLVRQEGERLRAQAGLRYVATTLDGIVGRIDRLEGQMKEAAHVANGLTQAVNDARARAEDAETRAEGAEASLKTLQGSRSWRVMAPFRRIGAVWRGR